MSQYAGWVAVQDQVYLIAEMIVDWWMLMKTIGYACVNVQMYLFRETSIDALWL